MSVRLSENTLILGRSRFIAVLIADLRATASAIRASDLQITGRAVDGWIRKLKVITRPSKMRRFLAFHKLQQIHGRILFAIPVGGRQVTSPKATNADLKSIS